MSKKKIIFVTEALWIGGIETALTNLLNRIDYNKYDVSLLICRASLDLLDRVNRNCQIIILDRDELYSAHEKYRYGKLYHLTEESESLSMLHKSMMWMSPLIRWVENRLYIRYIREFLKEEKYDTAIIYSDRVAEIAVRGVCAHKYVLFYHHGHMEKRYHDEIAYRKSDTIVTVSKKKADELREFRPKYADKIVAIHNLVDIQMVRDKSKLEQPIHYDLNSFNIVTCGRLSYPKGIDWAVEACKILADKGYENIHWWVVGGGPDETALRQMVHEIGLDNQFHLIGMRDNPYPFIANADLYVQPSRYENYCVAIMEAMALCKPILATVSAADQQIESGVNGMLCPANAKGIADGIEYLMSHPEELERFEYALSSSDLDEENKLVMNQLEKVF